MSFNSKHPNTMFTDLAAAILWNAWTRICHLRHSILAVAVREMSPICVGYFWLDKRHTMRQWQKPTLLIISFFRRRIVITSLPWTALLWWYLWLRQVPAVSYQPEQLESYLMKSNSEQTFQSWIWMSAAIASKVMLSNQLLILSGKRKVVHDWNG